MSRFGSRLVPKSTATKSGGSAGQKPASTRLKSSGRRAPAAPDHDTGNPHPPDTSYFQPAPLPGTAALEAQADRVAGSIDGGTVAPASPGLGTENIPDALRRPVEAKMGIGLAGVRVHTGSEATARLPHEEVGAVTEGDDIYFRSGAYAPSNPDSRRLISHELAHVAQQRVGKEQELDWMEESELALKPRESPLLARPGAPQRGDCPGKTKAQKAYEKLKRGEALTKGEARSILDAYKGLNSDEQYKMIRDIYSYQAKTPPIQLLLGSLSEKDRFDTYAGTIKSMLFKVQWVATQGAAGGTGWGDMAKKQGAFMEAEAQAEALKEKQAAAKAKGDPIPTKVSSKETREAHEKAVAESSIAKAPVKTEWDAVVDKPTWFTNAVAVRKKVVAACAKKAPHLKIKKTDITLDPDKIAKRGKDIFSLSGRPMTVGISFIKTAEANADYVVGSVLHEIHGHPLHGGLVEGLEWKLYEESTKHFPSYVKPGDRGQEHDLYGYIGTEIFSEMMEADYSVPISKADKAKGIRGSDSPKGNIEERIGTLKKHYEPSIAKSLALGLWERFRIDPRLSASSLTLYKNAVNLHFPGAIK